MEMDCCWKVLLKLAIWSGVHVLTCGMWCIQNNKLTCWRCTKPISRIGSFSK